MTLDFVAKAEDSGLEVRLSGSIKMEQLLVREEQAKDELRSDDVNRRDHDIRGELRENTWIFLAIPFCYRSNLGDPDETLDGGGQHLAS